MKGDEMARTKVDPYQDPAYVPPAHQPHPVAGTGAPEQPLLAPEKPAGTKGECSDQVESFVRGRVDDMLKRTHAQAEADVP